MNLGWHPVDIKLFITVSSDKMFYGWQLKSDIFVICYNYKLIVSKKDMSREHLTISAFNKILFMNRNTSIFWAVSTYSSDNNFEC